MGNVDRRRHTVWGAETSGVVWWVACTGDLQVGGALRQYRNWRAVATQIEGYDNEHMLIGAGRMRRELERS